jgi:multisubunit Na+/H+ antiporter MnhC subunit
MIMDTQLASLLTAGMLMVIGIFGALFLDNLIKKVISLAFIGDGANLFLIAMGYKVGGIVYIYLPGMSMSTFFTECILSSPVCSCANKYCYRGKYNGCDAWNNNPT